MEAAAGVASRGQQSVQGARRAEAAHGGAQPPALNRAEGRDAHVIGHRARLTDLRIGVRDALREGPLLQGDQGFFDLIEDGSVLYSTGSAIHYIGADGRHQRLLGGERVEALVAFS